MQFMALQFMGKKSYSQVTSTAIPRSFGLPPADSLVSLGFIRGGYRGVRGRGAGLGPGRNNGLGGISLVGDAVGNPLDNLHFRELDAYTDQDLTGNGWVAC